MEGETSIKITSCKFCKKEVLPTKIIMHIKRNKKCKEDYGEELQFLEEEQSKVRKKYLEKYQEKYRIEYKERNKEILRKQRAKKYQEQISKVAIVKKSKMYVKKEEMLDNQAQKKNEDNKKEKLTKGQNTKRKLDLDSSDEDVFDDEKILRYRNRQNNEKLYKKKPYVLTRSKVDFTMEDLENATEEDNDFSPNLSVPDISERLQLNRKCKRDLFLNQ